MTDGIRRNRVYFLANTNKIILDRDLSNAVRGTFDVEREVVHEHCELLNGGMPAKYSVFYIELNEGLIEQDEKMDILDLYPPKEWRQRNEATRKERK